MVTLGDRVFPELFWTDDRLQGSERRYAHLLDAQRLGLVPEDSWEEIRKAPPKTRAKKLADLLLKPLDLPKAGLLFTLVIDGTALAKLPTYQRFLVEGLVDEAFEAAQEALCHVCGSRGPATADFTRFRLLKFYINDKLSFAYGLDPAQWTHSYAVCRRCYVNLLAGERRLDRDFGAWILQSEALIVPRLATRTDPAELAQKAREAVTGLDWLENVPRLLHDLGRLVLLPQLTLLFVERSQSAVKVRESVPEVEPSRIMEVLSAMARANQRAEELFHQPPQGYWLPGLRALLRLLPLRHQKGIPETGPALRALRGILLDEPSAVQDWVKGFLEILRFAFHENPGLYATRNCAQANRCPSLHDLIAQMAAFLFFLSEAGLIEEGIPVTVEAKDYRTAIEALGLDAPRAALFLLGVLLARVASEQYKKGKSKPILEKIGYQGMPPAKVKRFAVEVFEKLGEYRRLDASAEAVFGEAMELLAQHEGTWPLSDEENAFYTLLGYGYETRRILTAAVPGGEGE